jgi:hypothetical protein
MSCGRTMSIEGRPGSSFCFPGDLETRIALFSKVKERIPIGPRSLSIIPTRLRQLFLSVAPLSESHQPLYRLII